MEIFDKIGQTANETYNYTVKQTGKFTRFAKLKLGMAENRAKIDDIYTSIGEQTYRKHMHGGFISEDLLNECKEIDKLADKVEQARMEILSLKEKRQCEK